VASHVIETHSLTTTYGDVVALEDVSLQVPKHSIFGFLGPNGAGKTTTMKMLTGAGSLPPGRSRLAAGPAQLAECGLRGVVEDQFCPSPYPALHTSWRSLCRMS
jgi:ABC-type branched-subunit amino acid transport system ATPase component